MTSSLPAIRPLLHPMHGLMLSFPVALFFTAMLSDIAYLETAEMQWSNFASWLIAGALIVGGPVLLWAVIMAFVHRRRAIAGRARLYALCLAGMWVAGLVNAFQHSHDGWSSVGLFGLGLSLISSVLALVAGWIAHASVRETAR